MNSSNTISFVVPALNEEAHLEESVTAMVAAGGRWFDEYEILVFNDGSTDRTGAIAEQLARRYDRVKAFHNERPRCLGGVMRQAAKLARMTYFLWGSSTGSHTVELYERIFAHKDRADMVIIYPTNSHERPLARQAISWSFQTMLNLLFGLHLRYYNNSVLYRTDVFRKVDLRTDSYAFQAEAIIKLIKTGHSFVEVPIVDNFKLEGRRSNAFKPRNVAGVAAFFWRMVRDVYLGSDLPAPASGERRA